MSQNVFITPCNDNPDRWFEIEYAAEAKAACNGCPLMQACRTQGKHEEFGIWGGVAAPGTMAEQAEAHRDSICERYKAGEGRSAIARSLGMTKSQIDTILRGHAPVPDLSLEERRKRNAEIIELARAGELAYGEIAERFGITKVAVSNLATAAGIYRRAQRKAG